MDDPIKLYHQPELREPSLVAAWPGMGNVALGSVGYLKGKLEAREFAEIEPLGFFELPGVFIEDGLVKPPRFPESKFYYWQSPSRDSDLIIFIAEAQPTINGYHFANCVIDVAQRLGTKRIYTCAAAPTSIRPGQKPRVWAVANQPRLVEYLKSYDVALMEAGHISGMNGLLLGVAAERGIPGLCLLGELPFYNAAIPNPRASQAVLEVLSQLLAIEIDMAQLEAVAKEMDAEMERQFKKWEQMARFAQQLMPQEPSLEEEARPSPEEEIQLRLRIERLFDESEKDRSKTAQLKSELDRWGLFEEYEDRFLNLFRKGSQ